MIIERYLEGDQLYIQALTALPVCLLLFAGGALALGIATRDAAPPWQLAAASAIFALGLGAASVQTSLAPLALLLLAPLAGTVAASAVLGRRFALVAIPVALLPATFLSAHNTGLLVIALGCSVGVALFVRYTLNHAAPLSGPWAPLGAVGRRWAHRRAGSGYPKSLRASFSVSSRVNSSQSPLGSRTRPL